VGFGWIVVAGGEEKVQNLLIAAQTRVVNVQFRDFCKKFGFLLNAITLVIDKEQNIYFPTQTQFQTK
jgi:hypothetical protein